MSNILMSALLSYQIWSVETYLNSPPLPCILNHFLPLYCYFTDDHMHTYPQWPDRCEIAILQFELVFHCYVTSNHRCGKMNYRPFITQSFCRLEMCALDWFSQVQVKVSPRLGSWQKPLASPLVNWSSGVSIMRMLKEAHCLMHRGLAEGVWAYLKNCFKQHLD